MRIKIINPNTTWAMTQKIQQSAQSVALADSEIIAVSPDTGPATVESYYDDALAAVGILQEIQKDMQNQNTVDGYIIACFGDPALYAARELAQVPVIGIAEAAMHTASLIAPSFSVVTTLKRTVNIAWHLVERYGMQRFCKNIHACDLPVAALENTSSSAYQQVLQACRQALQQDDSESLILGCAGMSDLCTQLTADLNVPVIDGVTAAVKYIEALAQLKLTTNKHGDWAKPPQKQYIGLLQSFSIE